MAGPDLKSSGGGLHIHFTEHITGGTGPVHLKFRDRLVYRTCDEQIELMQSVLHANESDADLGSDVCSGEGDLVGTVPSNDFRHIPHMPDKGAKKNIVASVPIRNKPAKFRGAPWYLLEGACFKVHQISGLPIPSIQHLHSTIIKPCIDEIALQESDKVMNDPRLKVRLKDCTLNYIRNVLNPGILPRIYLEDAPYTWGFLSVFTTSPNEYRKKRAQKGAKAKVATLVEPGEWEETPNGSSDDGATFAGETGGFWKDMGFMCNATFALVFVISIMALTRNTGTNVFPMILDLFLEIGGTSSRILNTLSNAGACVSITIIECLKRIRSEDAVACHQPNPRVPYPSAEDLEAKKKRCGKRAAATCTYIVPTDSDEAKMFSSFVGLVMTLILAYCPGSKEWEGRNAVLKAAEDMITGDRQGFSMTHLPTVQARAKTQQRLTGTKCVGEVWAGIGSESKSKSKSGGESASESDLNCTKWGKEMSEWSKTNRNETQQGQGAEGMVRTACVLGGYGMGEMAVERATMRVINFNEGSKKGIIKILKKLREFSGFTESEWAAKARIIVGDWLTSNNIWGARRD
ncbi:hypothetical protein DFH08DRAFT_812587 [Mycena albidolilacea]|uniref:Uncharacterized protein n=1 Tax=Mycena albidolilacea TaxID=1033008 RepID=A0AAD6ZTQ9_9AGAR|nr:hypothetical protein DFH08DRAFT_812587 [Mycena albidolilacea]